MAAQRANPDEITAEVERQLRAKTIELGGAMLKGEFLGTPTEVPCFDLPPCLCLEEHRVKRNG